MRWLLLLVVACAAPARTNPAPPSALASAEASVDLDGKPIGHEAVPTLVVVFASWCPHCHEELAIIDQLRTHHHVRILGLNYKGHEEYDHRGGAVEVRRYIAEHAAWLRVVPADDALFTTFGSPPKIPTMYLYDAHGAPVETFDRAARAQPSSAELEAALVKAGA